MQFNKIGLTLVAFLSYMIMAGLLTQTGVIMSGMADYLNISLTAAASMFSLLTGGTFVGTFVSMALYSRFTIQQILKYNYIIFVILLLLLVTLDIRIQWVVSVYLFCLGVGCGIGLAGGAVIISKIFNEQKRASAFLATDCSFSFAGYLFPTAAALLLTANLLWTSSYALVGVLAIIIIFACYRLQFPNDERAPVQTLDSDEIQLPTIPNIWTARVFIMALALCIYLMSQTTFLTWAPSYLEQTFGLGSSQAANAVGNYWGPSIFGLLSITLLVNKIPVRPLLLTVSFCAVFISTILLTTDDPQWFLTVTLALGFMTSCIFKLGISVGSEQVSHSPPILVTFLLCSATVGSTLAPAVSALVVSYFGVVSAMVMAVGGFSFVFLLFVLCLLLEKQYKSMQVKH
jgi:MFS transporter, TsgA protein